MRIGLTFDECVELWLKPAAWTSDVLRAAAESERERLFPMSLASASGHLRSRGYDCKPPMLELLVRNGVVTPADLDEWSQADVDAAAEHFEQCRILTPCAAMCESLGCRFANLVRSMRGGGDSSDG